MRRYSALPILLLALLCIGCGSDRQGGAGNVSSNRDTLPDGTILVRYGALPANGVPTIALDLLIGSVDGDANTIFGDIRGVEAGRDGTIYVLDHQASDIRAFDQDGLFVRTVASRGDGPGELTAANGMILVGDSILWVQDHGKWSMLGLSPEGRELARIPMHVRSYYYIWRGTVDDDGRIWRLHEVTVDPSRGFPPEEGLNEARSRRFVTFFDPQLDQADSVYLGEGAARSYVARNTRGGYTYRNIPFDADRITIVDRVGRIWHTDNTGYRIARIDHQGDTAFVIEADIQPSPVTSRDRENFIDQLVETNPDGRRVTEEIASLIGPSKPWIQSLRTDDRNRLWVRRVVPDGEYPLFDVYDDDGDYRESLRLEFQPAPSFPITVRNGHLFTVVLDSLDVPYVARASVPEL